MEQLSDINSTQVILLTKETSLASTSISQGLTALRKAHFAQKGLYYQAFFLLTIGIERILKLTIIVKNIVEKDKFPENKELKKHSHNLKDLFIHVSSSLRPEDNFLVQNDLYLPILEFLSNYSSTSRYYNLDTLSGKTHFIDPIHEWHNIQKTIQDKYCKTTLSETDRMIIENLEGNSIFMYRDESDTPILTPTKYITAAKYSDEIQGFSVLLIYKIVDYLILLLTECAYKKRMLPEYSEFFQLFQSEYMTDQLVRKKKDWNRL